MIVTVGDILDRVREIIAERGRQRDKPQGERSMGRAVQAFNVLYREQIAMRGGLLSEADGWALLDLLKRARGRQEDDVLDGVGYRALEAECVMREAVRRAPDERG